MFLCFLFTELLGQINFYLTLIASDESYLSSFCWLPALLYWCCRLRLECEWWGCIHKVERLEYRSQKLSGNPDCSHCRLHSDQPLLLIPQSHHSPLSAKQNTVLNKFKRSTCKYSKISKFSLFLCLSDKKILWTDRYQNPFISNCLLIKHKSEFNTCIDPAIPSWPCSKIKIKLSHNSKHRDPTIPVHPTVCL